jgi:integrase
MPRKLERALSARFCASAVVGMHCDGEGLYLQVKPRKDGEGFSRSWIFRYRTGGRLRDMGLGSFPTVGLADARERARMARLQRFDGIDPLISKRQAKIAAATAAAKDVPFSTFAQQYIESRKAGWKSDKHGGQWLSTLKTYAFPLIGQLPVSAIGDTEVIAVLKPIWTTKTETANRVRGRIEKILANATMRGQRSGPNPARWSGHLDQEFTARSEVAPVKHHKALPYADLPTFMAKLRVRSSLSARALEYTILTAVRTNDTISALRSEVDRKAKVWTIPGVRLKGKKGADRPDHVVPLSDRALQILDELSQDSEYLFAHDDGSPLSNMAMLEQARGMGFGDLTVHGFRSTFKDWAAETTEFPNELSEMVLAHTVGDKVEAAYRRGTMREKRRAIMADWSKFANQDRPVRGDVAPMLSTTAIG